MYFGNYDLVDSKMYSYMYVLKREVIYFFMIIVFFLIFDECFGVFCVDWLFDCCVIGGCDVFDFVVKIFFSIIELGFLIIVNFYKI